MIAVRRYIITLRKGNQIAGAFHSGSGEGLWRKRRLAERDLKKLIPPERQKQFHVVPVVVVVLEDEE